MSNLIPANSFDDVYQIEKQDPWVGGAGGLANKQGQNLTNRTEYLKAELLLHALINSPAFTGQPTTPTPTFGTNTMQIANTAFVQAAITALINTSPAALDTLNELATALGNDPNFATTITNALALKAALASPAFTGTPTAPTAAAGTNTTQLATTAFLTGQKDASGGFVGMSLFKINFRNALNTITSFFTNANTAARTYTFQDRDGTIADNIDLAAKANLANPAFTGIPTGPTAAAGTNTTQLATTAFTQSAVAALIASSPAALDTLNELATALGNDPNFATTITNALALKAPLNSPVLTGDPQAPTPAIGDNDTSIATTAFVQTAIAAQFNTGDYKNSVRVATTVAINLAAPGASIDGVAMVAGDRFLDKDNSILFGRGIYIWNGAAVSATRALDADTGAEFNGGAIIPVESGTVNADTDWQLTNDGIVTIGTTGLTFIQIGAPQAMATIQGAFKNLQASSTGLNANVSVTADEIVVEDAGNTYKTLRAVNLTIAGTASGAANGLDTGALAISSWYSVWVIWNGVTTAGLLSLSATAPTLPAGYTHKARIGWIQTDGTVNKFPLAFSQFGRIVSLSAYPLMGNYTVAGTPTTLNIAYGSFFPSTAGRLKFRLTAYGATGAAYSYLSDSSMASAATPGSSSHVMDFVNRPSISTVSWTYYHSVAGGNSSISSTGWEDNI